MCGIAGTVGSKQPEKERLLRSGELMRHRGPDSAGYWNATGVEMVFRRLAIIDLSPSGNQPMANEDGRVQVVFNGEIYNFGQLRTELEQKHRFRSHTDTEVLLHGYEEWGVEGLLQRIDGMFAFALWDGAKQELLLARDRIGKKPLYYSEVPPSETDGEGTMVAFASTLNALCELLPRKPEIDPVALDEYLIYQAVPAPRTIYQGVRMLLPGHFARVPHGRPAEVQRYWELSYATKIRRSEADVLEELDQLLRDAVKRRLVADVPLGAFLSGGVDSSIVLGIMSSLGAGPVEAVNIGFDDAAFDERPYARQVAAKWKANLHEHVISPLDVRRLPEIVWHYGQPLADVSIVPTFSVAQAAREHVTVALNGDGADEAFGGYSRPVVARAAQGFREGLPSFFQGAARSLLPLLGKHGRMLAEAVASPAREAFAYRRGLRNVRERLYSPELLSALNGHAHPDANYAGVWDRADGPTDVDRTLFGEIKTYLPDQLLVKMDVSTMAHSVEARSPFLDTRVIEFAATIPASQLMRGFQTKTLLKKLAERYAPPSVIYRRKKGFVMPVSPWLRGELAPYLKALLGSRAASKRGWFNPDVTRCMIDEHLSGKNDWGNGLWTLIILEIWCRLFVDGTLSRHDSLEVILSQ